MMNRLRWLYPGIHIKRWIAVTAAGIVFFGAGFTSFAWRLLQDRFDAPLIWYGTLQFLPYPLRGYLFVTLGLALLLLGLFRLYRAFLAPFLGALQQRPLVEHMWLESRGTLGPNIVAMGGGKHFHALLRNLRPYSSNLVAIIPAPECIIQEDVAAGVSEYADSEEPIHCLLSLAAVEQEMSALFAARIKSGADNKTESFGRLLLRALGSTAQDPGEGIRRARQVLAMEGQLIPATAEAMTINIKRLDRGPGKLDGQRGAWLLEQGTSGLHVSIQPPIPTVVPDALMAILDADLLVVGPGSMAAQTLPLFLIEPIANAVAISSAVKIFVCGMGDGPAELSRLGAHDQMETLARLSKELPFHFMVIKDDGNGLATGKNLWDGRRNGLPKPVVINGSSGTVDEDGSRLAAQLLRTYYEMAGRWARGRAG